MIEELEVLLSILGDDIRINEDNNSGVIDIVLKPDDSVCVKVAPVEAQAKEVIIDEYQAQFLPPVILKFSLPKDYPGTGYPGRFLIPLFQSGKSPYFLGYTGRTYNFFGFLSGF